MASKTNSITTSHNSYVTTTVIGSLPGAIDSYFDTVVITDSNGGMCITTTKGGRSAKWYMHTKPSSGDHSWATVWAEIKRNHDATAR